MYHPSRGGVRGGRDQFSWDDVKADKHRENYLGHSIKAPVGRWQKGKDLHWYSRDKKSESLNMEAAKEEIKRIKEEEEQAMREALGLAPKRVSRPQGNRLDKHEYAELVKRGSAAEDLGGGHAEAAQVQGLGLYKVPINREESSLVPDKTTEVDGEDLTKSTASGTIEVLEEETSRKKRRHEERRDEREKKCDRHDKKRSYESDDKKKHRSRDSDDKRRHRRDKEKRRRHDSD